MRFSLILKLFGDAMNTSSRMESTGIKNKIQVSQQTAEKLMADGKKHWLRMREDRVIAKGKGVLTTYFIVIKERKRASEASSGASSRTSSDNSSSIPEEPNSHFEKPSSLTKKDDTKKNRFVEYNTEVLKKVLNLCLVQRKASGLKPASKEKIRELEQTTGLSLVIDEFQEVITMSKLFQNLNTATTNASQTGAELGEAVSYQLRRYVGVIADMYPDNPFHNVS